MTIHRNLQKCNFIQKIFFLSKPRFVFSLFKPKSCLIKKFFNEPVDALDSRLANAEKNLSCLPIDPFNDIKQVNGLTHMRLNYTYQWLEVKICLYFFQNKHLIFIKEQPQEIYQDDEYPLDCSEVQLDPAWRSVGEQNQSEGRTFPFQVLQRNFLFKAYLISLELTFHVFLLFNKIVFVFLLQKNTKFFMK